MKLDFRKITAAGLVVIGLFVGRVQADRNDLGEPRVLQGPMVSEPQLRDPYSYSPNFGLLTFDTTDEDPWLRFELINVWGDSVWDATELRASELKNGVSSWRQKSSRRTKERYEIEYEAP
jgi:hypothetical protein